MYKVRMGFGWYEFALLLQVRRVRRCNSSSPDSDDTYGGEEDDVGLGKDDQYLVSDRTENKFYGSVHAAAAASSCGSAHQYPGNTPIIGPPLNYLQRRLQVGSKSDIHQAGIRIFGDKNPERIF